MPLFADDSTVTLTFSTTALFASLGTGLPLFGVGIWRLLAWFLAKIDAKDAKHAQDIEKLTDKFMLADSAHYARADRSEARSLQIHDRAVTAIEAVKASLDRMSERIEALEDGSPEPRSLPQPPPPARQRPRTWPPPAPPTPPDAESL